MADERLSYEEFRTLETELAAAGYQPHYSAIDHNVVITHPCERDGGTMDYIGYRKESSYRAFAVCRICHTVIEF